MQDGKSFARRLPGMIGRGAIHLVIVLAALSAITALPRSWFEPRYIGQFIMANFGGPVLLMLLAGGIFAALRWRAKREKLALGIALLSALGLIAGGVVLNGYAQVAASHGLPVNYARVLVPGNFSIGPVEHTAHVYDRFEGEEVRLHVYRKPGAPLSGNAPLVVYIHGGGWVLGSESERREDMQWLTQMGYVVVGLDYSLSSEKRHLAAMTESQLGCGLAWIGSHARDFGADPSRIVLFGESAGGNLVLNISGKASRGELQSRCGGQVPKIAATFSVYPPVELATLYNHKPAQRFADAYIGGSPQQFPDLYAEVSPSTTVARPAPPVLILTGLDDSLVPVEGTLRYVDQARAARRDIELITIPRAGHGFDVISGGIGRQILRQSMIDFLRRKGLKP